MQNILHVHFVASDMGLHCFHTSFYGMLGNNELTLKVPITTAADDSLEYFFIVFRENMT